MRKPNVRIWKISHKKFLDVFYKKIPQCIIGRKCICVRCAEDYKNSKIVCLGISLKTSKRNPDDVFQKCIIKKKHLKYRETFNCLEVLMFKKALSFMWNLHKRGVIQ